MSPLVNGKPVPQTTRMSGKQMNLKFDGQNQLQQLVEHGRSGSDAQNRGRARADHGVARTHCEIFRSETGRVVHDRPDGRRRFPRRPARRASGNARTLDRATNTVTLDGSVVFTDATTRTTAQTATFAQGSITLRADGNVLTTELRARHGRAFPISRKSPRTFRRITWSRTRRAATPCTPGTADCGRGSR